MSWLHSNRFPLGLTIRLVVLFGLVIALVVMLAREEQRVNPEAPVKNRVSLVAAKGSLWLFATVGAEPASASARPVVDAFLEASRPLSSKYEVRLIDPAANAQLIQRHRISTIPTVLYLDAKGNELERVEGQSPNAVEQLQALSTRLSAQ